MMTFSSCIMQLLQKKISALYYCSSILILAAFTASVKAYVIISLFSELHQMYTRLYSYMLRMNALYYTWLLLKKK